MCCTITRAKFEGFLSQKIENRGKGSGRIRTHDLCMTPHQLYRCAPKLMRPTKPTWLGHIFPDLRKPQRNDSRAILCHRCRDVESQKKNKESILLRIGNLICRARIKDLRWKSVLPFKNKFFDIFCFFRWRTFCLLVPFSSFSVVPAGFGNTQHIYQKSSIG